MNIPTFRIKKFDSRSNKWFLFSIFLLILLSDRYNTLKYFGFVYTDLDQMVMWNGVLDYSQGIFHEPFFYGQAFNYMLESLFAVPLFWVNIPVYIALPIVTTILSIIPFIALAVYFTRRGYPFWAYLTLTFPVLLPLEYNFLTTISRGCTQANLFIPLLFIPLFNPQNKRNVTILYVVSGICLVANPSSALLIVPICMVMFVHQPILFLST
ncbi:MAG: hypothetical protein HRT72_02835 [Flavobacteriales bacterium]|nr:hypothetical protein [Flavobacteriales bacterium]